MIIKIPNNNIPERTYIINVIMGEFLGLSYSIQTSDSLAYNILFDSKEIIIEDHFFNHYQVDLGYLKEIAIPKSVEFGVNKFIVENDIPILYGNNRLDIMDEKIICGNDIFAASFFMLTRWEEYVKKNRDLHGRFSAKDSIAFKYKFLNRPIVNEYVEMLWNMLKYLGIKGSRKEKNYQFVLTHDVDHLEYYKGVKSVIKKILADIVKRRKFFSLFFTLKEYRDIKKGLKKDPYDTFDWMMEISEKYDLKSRFYFMADDESDEDNRYDINSLLAKQIINKINERGHIIGFHPGINTYNNPEKWLKEKTKLEKVLKNTVHEGRQHYLKFEVPYTYRLWEEGDMKVDSSLGYHDKEGFRCGVCYEFPVYDFLSRKKMKLYEYPLIAMEVTMNGYQNYTEKEMYDSTIELIKKVRKYNGNFVFLWHNSSFNISRWEKYNSVYEKILKNSDGETNGL